MVFTSTLNEIPAHAKCTGAMNMRAYQEMNVAICRLDRTGLGMELGTARTDGNCTPVVRRTNETDGGGNGNVFLTATVIRYMYLHKNKKYVYKSTVSASASEKVKSHLIS